MRGPWVAIRVVGIAGFVAMTAWAGSGPESAGGRATPSIPSWPAAARDSLKRSAFPRAVWETRDAIHRMLSFHRGMEVARASGRFEDPFGGRITSGRLMIHGTFREKPPY